MMTRYYRPALVFVLTILLAVLCQGELFAQTSKQKSQREKLEKEIAILDKQLKDNAARSSSALSSLSLVQKKVGNRKKLVAESDHQIAVLNDKMTAKQREINRLNERMDTLTIYYERLIRSAYKNRDARIWYMYILASDGLPQAMRRFAYLKNLSSQMNEQARRIRATREELIAQKEQLQLLRTDAVALRDSRAAELSRLQKDEKQSAALVSQLKKDKSKYQKQLAQKQKQMEALNKEVNKIISSSTSRTSKVPRPIDQKLSSQFEANKGKLPWPVDEGAVVDHFGQHYHPVYKTVKLPFNNGIGIAVATGTKVKAVFDGEVRQIIVMPGYNQCVLVQHGGYFTFYCKLGKVAVKAGEKVKTGQVLGTVDTIAGETQVHFQLWKSRTPQDPELWLRK